MSTRGNRASASSAGICAMIKTHVPYWRFDIAMAGLVDTLKKAKLRTKWSHVVGISDGGLPAGVHVAKHLGLSFEPCDPKALFNLYRVTAHCPLIVDDFFDTGKTVDFILNAVNKGAFKKYQLTDKNFAFAFCRAQVESKSGFIPRYYGRLITKQDGHLVFPWEPTGSP